MHVYYFGLALVLLCTALRVVRPAYMQACYVWARHGTVQCTVYQISLSCIQIYIYICLHVRYVQVCTAGRSTVTRTPVPVQFT